MSIFFPPFPPIFPFPESHVFLFLIFPVLYSCAFCKKLHVFYFYALLFHCSHPSFCIRWSCRCSWTRGSRSQSQNLLGFIQIRLLRVPKQISTPGKSIEQKYTAFLLRATPMSSCPMKSMLTDRASYWGVKTRNKTTDMSGTSDDCILLNNEGATAENNNRS